jgi:hypothetical protein
MLVSIKLRLGLGWGCGRTGVVDLIECTVQRMRAWVLGWICSGYATLYVFYIVV